MIRYEDKEITTGKGEPAAREGQPVSKADERRRACGAKEVGNLLYFLLDQVEEGMSRW